MILPKPGDPAYHGPKQEKHLSYVSPQKATAITLGIIGFSLLSIGIPLLLSEPTVSPDSIELNAPTILTGLGLTSSLLAATIGIASWVKKDFH